MRVSTDATTLGVVGVVVDATTLAVGVAADATTLTVGVAADAAAPASY